MTDVKPSAAYRLTFFQTFRTEPHVVSTSVQPRRSSASSSSMVTPNAGRITTSSCLRSSPLRKISGGKALTHVPCAGRQLVERLQRGGGRLVDGHLELIEEFVVGDRCRDLLNRGNRAVPQLGLLRGTGDDDAGRTGAREGVVVAEAAGNYADDKAGDGRAGDPSRAGTCPRDHRLVLRLAGGGRNNPGRASPP